MCAKAADGQRRQAQAAHWVSTSADAYRARVHQSTMAAHEAADRLDAAATVLERHAQEVRQKLAEIAAAERAVLAFARSQRQTLKQAAVDVINDPPTLSNPVIGPFALPPSGDVRWLGLYRSLATTG